MGFCLFEEAGFPGTFLAANGNYIIDVTQIKRFDEGGVCALQFKAPLFQGSDMTTMDVFGLVDDIWALLNDCAKIGLNKSHLNLMHKLSARPMPLLVNEPDRIMLVRELQPEEFMGEDSSLLTASRLFFVDGKHRFISERPGTFVSLTNAGRKTPILKENDG